VNRPGFIGKIERFLDLDPKLHASLAPCTHSGGAALVSVGQCLPVRLPTIWPAHHVVERRPRWTVA
jgi:hypothetical protein